MQLRKLYKYWLGKIFKRNWIRITLIALVVVIGWWFAYPYVVYRTNKTAEVKNIEEATKRRRGVSTIRKSWSEASFKVFCQTHLGKKTDLTVIEHDERYKSIRENLKELLKKMKEKKTLTEKEIEDLKDEIRGHDIIDNRGIWFLYTTTDSPFTPNNVFVHKRTEGINKLKLLNDISWWNLTGTVALFWLFFNILDNLFFKPQRVGEESTILTLTPGVKRSDLFFSKILAFLTFYFIVNVFLFLVPFGFYYWWAGVNTSFGWFSLLALWTTIIGPFLFFALIFAPYLFLKSKISWLGWIISTLLSFFPIAWFWIKVLAPTQTWIWSIENWFFNPVWFVPISLITGIIFTALFCWHYEKQDLGK